MQPVLNQDQTALKTQNSAKAPALKTKPTMTRHVHAINRKHKKQHALNRFALSRISLALMTVLGADPALAATYTWVGPDGGVWSNVINWDLGTLPTLNDSISLGNINTFLDTGLNARNINGSGTLTIGNRNLDILGSLILNSTNSTSNLGGLNINHGGLTNNGRLIVSGTTNWSSGGFSGLGGVTRLEGNVFISGEFGKHLNGHTLEFSGNTTQTGLAGVSLSNNARIINSGTWIDQEANGSHFSGSGTFENQGSFIKSNGPNDFLFGSNFGITVNNTGSINVDRGYLSLSGGGTNSGQLNIAAGSTLGFKGGIFHLENQNVLNNGTLEVAAGTVNANLGLNLGGTTRITGGTLNLYSDSSFAVLSMSGGTLANNALLNISGNTQSNGGTLAGTGSTILNENLTFRGGLNPTRLLDTQTLTLKGITNNNALTTDTTRSVNYLQIGQGARVVNQGTWLDSTRNATTISGDALTTTGGIFENQGTYTKSQTSTTDIGGHGLTFNNSGTVNINAGKLRITADGTSSGIFNIAAGSELDFNAGAYLFNTANVNNAGTFKVSGATVTATQGLNLGGLTEIRGGTLNLQADSSMSDLNIVAGARLNNNAILSVAGASFFSSGIIAGAGTTVINGSLSLVGNSNNKLMDGQTLITKGITNIGLALSDNPTLAVFNGASVINQGDWNIGGIATSFALAISGDANSNTGGVFENQGAFNKSNPLISAEIGKHGLAFNNTGIVNVSAGKLAILGGGTSTGQINIASAGTLDFLTTAYNVGRNVSNAGSLRVSNGGILNANDGLNLGGSTVLNNGTLNLGASSLIASLTVDSTSTLNINAGALSARFASNPQGIINIASGAELNSGAAINSTINNSGTITGNGTVRTSTLNNSGSLAAGGLNSIGQLSIIGNLAQTSAGQINIDLARTAADLLAISGTATLSGALNVNVTEELVRGSNYKVLTWTDRTANSTFDTINFSQQAANYRLGTTYDVDGLTVSMKGYNFYWSGPENGGLWNVDQHWSGGNGGRPQAGDAAFLGNANTRLNNIQQIAEIDGSGTLTLAGYSDLRLSERANLGGLVLEHQSNFQNDGYAVVNGNSQWLGGILTGTGTTRFDGDLVMAGSTRGLRGGHTLELNGTSTYADSNGVMYVSEGARIINNGQWITRSNGVSHSIGNGFGGANGTFDNIGTFTMASPDPNARFSIGSITFNNTGTLNVNSGMLDIQSKFNSITGQINISGDGKLRLSSGIANLKGTINNGGTLRIEGRGVFNPIDSLIVQGGQTILNDSTINNNHSLRITGAFDWKQGTIAGAGTTRLEGNTTLSESTHAVMNGHTIEFAGNTYHTGGIIYTGQGSRLINLGTWTEQNTGYNSISNGYGGASSTFDNVGTFNKASNAMLDIGGGVTFNNTGTLNVNAGTLRFSDGFNSATGQINIANGATLRLSGNANVKGTINNVGTLNVPGILNTAGNLLVQGGQTMLNANGTINNSHLLRLAGDFFWGQGTIRGTGTTRFEGNTTLGESTHAVTNGHTIEFAGNTYHTGGIIYTGQGSRLVNLGTWQDQNTGNIDISNGFGGSSSSFDNQGTFIKSGSAMTTFGGDLDLKNTGNIQINAGTLRLLNNFNNHGQMNVAAGAELSGNTSVFGSAGTVTGDGTIRASSNFTNTGTLATGGLDDAGHLSLIGNFTQGSSGNFLVDLGGVDAGTFDLFSITGNALLGGTLAVNILDGVQFNLGDSFTVMTWNQRLSNSQFANLDFTQANGYQFNAEYNDNNLTLRIVAVPVPEPSSAALLGLGLLGLTGYRLTRKTAAG